MLVFAISSFRTGGIARHFGWSRLFSLLLAFRTSHVAMTARIAAVAVDLCVTVVSCVAQVTTSVALGVRSNLYSWWNRSVYHLGLISDVRCLPADSVGVSVVRLSFLRTLRHG